MPDPSALLAARVYPRHLAPIGVAMTALVLMAAASLYLWPFWRESSELHHGFAVPWLCLWLFGRSSREPSLASGPRTGKGVMLLQALGLLLFIGTASVTGMAALAQGLEHNQTAFLVACSLTGYLLICLWWLDRRAVPWVRWNGTSLAAALLWLLVVPLPPGTLSRITLFFQDHITAGVLHTLHLLGIPAERWGHVLEIAGQKVGVAEACSGIISLLACLFAGVFLGGLLLSGLWWRLALVMLAAGLAVVMNFFRTLLLCLLVARGHNIDGALHDWSGFLVLVVTSVVLVFIAQAAEDWSRRKPRVAHPSDFGTRSPSLWLPGLAGAVIVMVTLFIASRVERQAGPSSPPDLASLLVIDHPDWQRRPDPGVARFAAALNTDILHMESYLRGNTMITFYMAYWPAGLSTLGSVGLHTPDMCLPGAGWSLRPPPAAGGLYPLPQPRRYAFAKDGYPLYVWFWHFYGGYRVEEPSGFLPWQLAPQLIHRPVSSRAYQWVLRVTSNQPLESLIDEPLVQEMFTRVRDARLLADG
jgi:exosortase